MKFEEFFDSSKHGIHIKSSIDSYSKDASKIREIFKTEGVIDPSLLWIRNPYLIYQAVRNKRFSLTDVAYYPLGAGDAITPALLTDAKVIYTTSYAGFGKIDDVNRVDNDISKIFGNTVLGNYDRDIGHSAGLTAYSGPNLLRRAIIAEQSMGRNVTNGYIFSFDIDDQGRIAFRKPDTININENGGFVLTTEKDGKEETKWYFNEQLRLPVGRGFKYESINGRAIADLAMKKVTNAKKFMASVSSQRGTVMLAKGVPVFLTMDADSKVRECYNNTFSFPESLLKGIVREEVEEINDRKPCRVGTSGLKVKEVVDCEPFRVKFGRGHLMYLDTPEQSDPIDLAHVCRYDEMRRSGKMIFQIDELRRLKQFSDFEPFDKEGYTFRDGRFELPAVGELRRRKQTLQDTLLDTKSWKSKATKFFRLPFSQAVPAQSSAWQTQPPEPVLAARQESTLQGPQDQSFTDEIEIMPNRSVEDVPLHRPLLPENIIPSESPSQPQKKSRISKLTSTMNVLRRSGNKSHDKGGAIQSTARGGH